jgi:hypothetical protein
MEEWCNKAGSWGRFNWWEASRLTRRKISHGGRSRADFHDLLHQRVGHAVEASVEGDVLVDVRRGTGPLAQIEVFCGQGRQSRPVQNVEQAVRDPSRPEWADAVPRDDHFDPPLRQA